MILKKEKGMLTKCCNLFCSDFLLVGVSFDVLYGVVVFQTSPKQCILRKSIVENLVDCVIYTRL